MPEYLGHIPRGSHAPVLLLALRWRSADRCELTCSLDRVYTVVVTARGWAAVRAALVPACGA